MTYLISDNHDSWEVTADTANDAVARCYEGNAGCALEVLARDDGGDWQTVLYALVDADGNDHSSWSPRQRGPVETEWCPVWQTQG